MGNSQTDRHKADRPKDTDEINVRGRIVRVPAMEIDGKRVIVTGSLVKVARLKEEWFEDLEDPASFTEQVKKAGIGADIFTFWQRFPQTQPQFDYYFDRYSLATLPVSTYDDWWSRIGSKTRNMVRKAEKKGIRVERTSFDDTFVDGMVEIFNETPIRQGYQFPNYGKSFETVRTEFSEHLQRAIFLGAYHGSEMVGFCIIVRAGTFAVTSQFLCKLAYRDMATPNGLMAKVVETCIKDGIPCLVYGYWHEGTLGDFVRHHGFEKIDLPQYYVPLTLRGRAFLKLGIHNGLAAAIPKSIKPYLLTLRKTWFRLPWYSERPGAKMRGRKLARMAGSKRS